MPKVVFIKNGERFEVETETVGSSLLEIAKENNIDMDNACGGNGICTTCMIRILEGQENAGPMTEREEIMGMDPEDPSVRLGCQCMVNGDMEVELAY
jgi:ferredoxin